MKNSVQVTIERRDNAVIVSNDKGCSWKFEYDKTIDIDTSVNGVVADISSAMLTGTIASQLKEVNSPKITYTLTIEI